MDTIDHLNNLRDFVKEIRDYYILSNHASEGPFTISRAMATFPLSRLEQHELEDVLKALEQRNHILSNSDSHITFSQEFLASGN